MSSMNGSNDGHRPTREYHKTVAEKTSAVFAYILIGLLMLPLAALVVGLSWRLLEFVAGI